jgi:hypothetical protein
MKRKLIKTKFFPPYASEGKTNLSFCSGKSGVYIIKKGTQIVYIGYSESNLYKTITRHFQSWKDSSQVRVTYPQIGVTIRVVITTPARAAALERALIVKHRPADNPNKLNNYLPNKQDDQVNEWYDEEEAFGVSKAKIILDTEAPF